MITVLGIIAWLLVGIVVMIFDQSIDANKDGLMVTIFVVGWPVIAAVYLAVGVYHLLSNSGHKITEWGIRLKEYRRYKAIEKESKP